MFEFYTNNTFEGTNSASWIPIAQIFVQSLTLFIAFIALYTARKSLNTANENLGTANKNLQGVSRTQSVQAHMNLITLETDITKNIVNLAIATRKLEKATLPDEIEALAFEENTAFTSYLSSLDKLASIINTPYFPQQFINTKGEIDKEKWEIAYYDTFNKAKTSGNTNTVGSVGKFQMIQNITALLDIWDKENLENPPNTITTNSLPNT